jgi:serine phosphatase RsbU (regulator of sigma subunit)/anti-sigma regulatory factor (Ser/Thr protein kinase)
MKKRTIATKIMLPVFGVVLIFQIAVSLLGYYSYRQNNEASYEEENAQIIESAALSFNGSLLTHSFDETASIYNKNVPTKNIDEMSKDEQTTYYNQFANIRTYKDEDNTNYYLLYLTIFSGMVRGSTADAFNVGFVDKTNNRFVSVFSYFKENDTWPSIGYYFELPSPILEAENNNLTSFSGKKYSRNSSSLFSNGAKCDQFTNEDIWVIYDQSQALIDKTLKTFMVFFFSSMAIVTLAMFVALYFLLNHFAVKKIKALANKSQEYTDSLKQGEIKTIFAESTGKPDEIDTLNDSFYSLDQELRDYVAKVKLATTNEEKLNAELSLATKIQLSALPKNTIHNEMMSLSAFISPAKEVGGDLYGYEQLSDNKLYLFVGDVSGKGVPAALFMMQAKTLLQESLSSGGLLEAVTRTNKRLLEENSEALFLTAFIGIFDSKTGELHYVNAGHEPALICHDGVYHLLKEVSDVPLACLDNYSFHEQVVKLLPGDRLFLYTDGVSESMSKEGQLYGKERIVKTINSLSKVEDKEVIEGMNKSLEAHSLGRDQYDDICMLSFSFLHGEELLVKEEDDLEKIPEFVEKRVGKYLSKNDVSSIDVILDELVSNILFYSGTQKEPISLTLSYSIKDGAYGYIRDHGVAFNPLKDAPKRKEGQIGGLGITVSKALASSLDYARIGSTNLLSFSKKKTGTKK